MNIFSVHLLVLGTTIVSDGKGCTKELTLASAYGELVERLSFLLPFRVSPFYRLFYDTVENEFKKENFSLFKKIDFDKWINSEDSYLFFNSLQKYNFFLENQTTYKNLKSVWKNRKNSCSNFSFGAEYLKLDIIENTNFDIISSDSMIIPLSF